MTNICWKVSKLIDNEKFWAFPFAAAEDVQRCFVTAVDQLKPDIASWMTVLNLDDNLSN